MSKRPTWIYDVEDIAPQWRRRLSMLLPMNARAGLLIPNAMSTTWHGTGVATSWLPSGLQFNGTSSYATIPNNDWLDFGTNEFTVACEFCMTGKTGVTSTYHQGLICRQQYSGSSGGEYEWALYVVNTDPLRLAFSVNESYVNLATIIYAGTCYNVAVVRRGDAGYLYVNGHLAASYAGLFAGLSLSPDKALLLGKRSDGRYYYGSMQWAGIWRRALTDAELLALGTRGLDAMVQPRSRTAVWAPTSTTHYGSAMLTGLGQLDPKGIRVALGSALLDGAATLTADGIRVALGSATIDGAGSIDAAGIRVALAAAALDASGALDVNGIRVALGQALLNGQADITPNGSIIASASAIFNASADLQAAGRKVSITFTGDTINFLFPRDVADFTFDRDTVRFNTP